MAMESRASPSIPRRGSSKDLPFYEVPQDKITPARIVSEAKNSIGKQAPLKPLLNTRRPETPRDEQRKLFGEQSERDPTERPPSSFSLGSRHFNSDSRPVSGIGRLAPLDHTPRLHEGEPKAPKPPQDPSRRRSSGNRTRYQHSVSVDASEGLPPRSSSHHDNLNNGERRVGSGEKRVGSGEKRIGSGEKRIGSGEKRNGSGETRRSHRRSADVSEIMGESGYSSDVRGGSAESRDVNSRGGSASSQGPGSAGKSRITHSTSENRLSNAGKPGSGGRREEENSAEKHLYNTRIGPIIEEMSTHIKDKDRRDPDRLLELSEELYRVLDEADLLGKNCTRRPLILKPVFKLLDLVCPRLLLKLARLILALKVSGNNLTNVCKLVFKVSKDEKNDVHFTEDNILDLLVETAQSVDHVTCADALVYCVGALKFLSGTGTVVKVLAKRHCLHAMATLLTAINKSVSEKGKPQENQGHILVQLTSTLRNLAEVPSKRGEFISDGVLDELGCVMVFYFHDGDLMLNVVRIYSKLSVHNDVCGAMADEPKFFQSFVDLLNKYKKREDIIVRVCYILGNLTAKSDVARKRLWDTGKALDTLLSILKSALTAEVSSRKRPESAEESGKKKLDVLIKAVRVIANLSINTDIGPCIASSDQCVTQLCNILDNPNLASNEELLINTLSTVNNLSYYGGKDSAVTKRQVELAESLAQFIRKDNMEVLAETIRVLGNLTRERPTRQYMYKHKLDKSMVDLLDSSEKEVVYTACGVLINLMADEESRPMLRQLGGINKLLAVLEDFARDDWQLASLVCQILWNFSGRITSSNAMFGESEAQELSDRLVDYLDEEDVIGEDEDPEFAEYKLQIWREEFCPVAKQLLERVESHQSDFETLDHPS